MGTSLYYSTLTALSDDAIASIEKEVREESHTWWCEAISFFDTEGGLMSGGTKLGRVEAWTADGTVVRLSDAADALMTWRDCSVIVGTLAGWAKRYGVTWQLNLEEIDAGYVTPDGPDEEAVEFLQDFFGIGGSDVAPDRIDAEIERLLRTYPVA